MTATGKGTSEETPHSATTGARDAAGARQSGHTVDLDAITHRYGNMLAVDDVTLSVRAGEILALLGPSGCGKTTLLRIVAGFVTQSRGSVLIDGRSIDALPSNQREIGIVFQNYALFPHLTVWENVAYGLKARGRPRSEVQEKVARFLEVVQLDGLSDRLPRQLSGGQQQRVALARALAVEPRVLLLDEPFSALDKSLRLDMQIELRRLQKQFGLTAILVTHDQDEAMSVADRIAVMNRGRVEQIDSPVIVYDRPATLFVSSFVGTTNQLRGEIIAMRPGTVQVELAAGATLDIPTERPFMVGEAVIVTLRPEQLSVYTEAAADRWRVRPRLSVPIASSIIRELELRDRAAIKVTEPRGAQLIDVADEAWCGPKPGVRPSVFSIVADNPKEETR